MAKVTAQCAVGAGAWMLRDWEYIKHGESLKSFENEGKDLLAWQEKKEPGEPIRFQIKEWDRKIFFAVAFSTVEG